MKFLNLDSPFMRALSRMTDILWLNLLTLLLCIPIITAGAAFTALHYACLKMVRDEEGYVTKDYFRAFGKNFKQATIIWLIIILLAVILIFDYRCLAYISYAWIMFAAITAAAIFILCTALYVFPMLAHFENTIRGTIKNAFYMSILALPKTILMLLLMLAPFGILLAVEYFETMTWLIPLDILFWFGAPAYFSAKLYNKTFKKFEPETAAPVSDMDWTVGGEEENAEGATDTEVPTDTEAPAEISAETGDTDTAHTEE